MTIQKGRSHSGGGVKDLCDSSWCLLQVAHPRGGDRVSTVDTCSSSPHEGPRKDSLTCWSKALCKVSVTPPHKLSGKRKYGIAPLYDATTMLVSSSRYNETTFKGSASWRFSLLERCFLFVLLLRGSYLRGITPIDSWGYFWRPWTNISLKST